MRRSDDHACAFARISWGPEGVSERLAGPDVIAVEGDMLAVERHNAGDKF
jgi:hypothetical protein